ncbi:MAG: formate dehydrogenase subunit delta [Actinomycetes bacterium]
MEIDSLVRMANQIAANVAHHPPDQAAAEVAAHLRAFWAPSMRTRLAEWVDEGGSGLDPVAEAAVERLRASA